MRTFTVTKCLVKIIPKILTRSIIYTLLKLYKFSCYLSSPFKAVHRLVSQLHPIYKIEISTGIFKIKVSLDTLLHFGNLPYECS